MAVVRDDAGGSPVQSMGRRCLEVGCLEKDRLRLTMESGRKKVGPVTIDFKREDDILGSTAGQEVFAGAMRTGNQKFLETGHGLFGLEKTLNGLGLGE